MDGGTSVYIVESLKNLITSCSPQSESLPFLASSIFGCRRRKSHLFFAVVSAVSAAACECECPWDSSVQFGSSHAASCECP
jgi:hypothetical protein